MSDPAYRRILLKLSGEALAGVKGQGMDPEVALRIAEEIREIHELGVQTGVVIGGGNFIRGISASAHGLDRVAGDHMGMLATIINSLALQATLEKVGVPTRLMTAFEVRQIAEPFIRRRAVRHLEKNRVVIFAAGTGNPNGANLHRPQPIWMGTAAGLKSSANGLVFLGDTIGFRQLPVGQRFSSR